MGIENIPVRNGWSKGDALTRETEVKLNTN
jgi:hypothetical protein